MQEGTKQHAASDECMNSDSINKVIKTDVPRIVADLLGLPQYFNQQFDFIGFGQHACDAVYKERSQTELL